MNGRRFTWLGLGGLATIVGGCQLVSGLSGYQESGSSATGTGGAASSSGSGGAGGNGVAVSTSVGGGAASSGTGGCEMCSGNVCTDTQTDPANCGSCNKPCAAFEACVSGGCTDIGPYDSVTAISASAATVYWATKKGATSRIQYSTEPLWRVSTVDVQQPQSIGGLAIAADGASAYFTRSDGSQIGLYQWTPSSNPADVPLPISVPGTLDTAGAVHADTSRVVWGGHDPQWSGPNMAEWLVHATYVTSKNTDLPEITKSLPLFAGDSASIFWPDGLNKFIWANPPNPPSYFNYTKPAEAVAYIGADQTPNTTGYLYWVTTNDELFRSFKGPNGVTVVTNLAAADLSGAKGIAVLGTRVFFLKESNCGVGSGSLSVLTWFAGKPVENVMVVKDTLTCPRNLTIGGGFLYYSEGLAPETHLRRLAVPPP